MNRILCAAAMVLAGCSTPTSDTCTPACATGYVCTAGTCVPSGNGPDMAMGDAGGGACQPACGGLLPKCNASGHCVGCLSDGDCPNGKFCDIKSDTMATCAIGCTTDDRCGGGKCCNMRCVDVNSDPANCGTCGKACAGAHAQAACVGGQCAQGACDTGWGDCDGNAGNGCETNLHVDANNCAACGQQCAIKNAVNACADGCYIAACNFGFDDCNQDPKDGCEQSVLTDPNNCGACGNSCAGLPNAKANCTNGNCVFGACNAGFADCDGIAMNGCEVNLNNDAKNCAKCGVQCCQGLFCVQGVCKMGCLMGMGPPMQCLMDVDPIDKTSKWVICSADCNGAWIAGNTGGTYHAGLICHNLGYSKVGQYGGTCGNVCGYCEGATNCNMHGQQHFDNGGLQGMDMYGPILSFTVMWTCVP